MAVDTLTSNWPYRVAVVWPNDRTEIQRWLEVNVDATTWFWAAWSVLYFSREEDATRCALIWGA